MFDLVIRRAALLAAAPALLVLTAPALAHGPVTPPRPARVPAPPSEARPAPPRGPDAGPAPIRGDSADPAPIRGDAVDSAPIRKGKKKNPAPAREDRAAEAPAPVRGDSAASGSVEKKATPMVRTRTRAITASVLRLTNRERRVAGCPAVGVEPDLVTASAQQSGYMARTRLFSHTWRNGSTLATRAKAAGYTQPAGENIAWGFRSAREVVDAWMDSPGHRANILNCSARKMGAAVSYAADGTPYYTQVFGWR
ncbi:CAP domain-containing protein [Actinoplanes sp. NBRC 101535]|uniref:CAP domain-containing protein n=1 Tax=Actinoplanes sp. NBRC 101535 TaxID=3032196 RepID=UPI0024A04DE5|nr:CAP domain-containing protein [Actinoplanes sp. NBRC 101535]GLY03228.1 hypothetical protein Acsp01_36070 [Actinoplanes sp. NBRC 101535]